MDAVRAPRPFIGVGAVMTESDFGRTGPRNCRLVANMTAMGQGTKPLAVVRPLPQLEHI
jgi:hypothetical protein